MAKDYEAAEALAARLMEIEAEISKQGHKLDAVAREVGGAGEHGGRARRGAEATGGGDE